MSRYIIMVVCGLGAFYLPNSASGGQNDDNHFDISKAYEDLDVHGFIRMAEEEAMDYERPISAEERQDRLQSAIELLTIALSIYPHNLDIMEKLAVYSGHAGDKKRAKHWYMRLAEEDYDHAIAVLDKHIAREQSVVERLLDLLPDGVAETNLDGVQDRADATMAWLEGVKEELEAKYGAE